MVENEKAEDHQANEVSEPNEAVEDKYSCGLLRHRPDYLQKFKSINYFVVIAFFTLLFKDGTGIYMVTLNETIKKAFHLTNARVLIIGSISNIGPSLILFIHPFTNHFPKKTLWICVGLIISSIGLTIFSFVGIYPDYFHKQRLAYTTMTVGYFIFGCGSSLSTYLILTYIENNVEEERAPKYIGISLAGMVLGSALGGYLGTTFAEERSQSSDEGNRSLWFLGFLIPAIMLLVMVPFHAFFPTRFSPEHEYNPELHIMATFKKYFNTIKRVFQSRIYVLSLASLLMSTAAMQCFKTNFTQFVLFMYKRELKDLTLVVGAMIILTAVTNVMFGFFLAKIKPKFRYLAIWNIAASIVTLASVFVLHQTGCETPNLISKQLSEAVCDVQCGGNITNQGGPKERFVDHTTDYHRVAVCSFDNKTMFVDICHAGCPGTSLTNCSCAKKITGFNEVYNHSCPVNNHCNNLFIFYQINFVTLPILMTTATMGVGRYITLMRSVNKRDTDDAIMLVQVAIYLLAFLPWPPLAGLLLDKACRLHGDNEECQFYDKDAMRENFYFAMMVFIVLVLVCEILLYVFGKEVNLYGKEKPKS